MIMTCNKKSNIAPGRELLVLGILKQICYSKNRKAVLMGYIGAIFFVRFMFMSEWSGNLI